MGEISIERQHLERQREHVWRPYQQAFAELAESRRSRPVAESFRCFATDEVLRGFTDADPREQAKATISGESNVLRVK